MMETLFVVAQHSRSIKGHSPSRYGSFESPPSKGFRDINCRTFQSGHGILPTPQNSYSSVPSPKTQSSKDLKTSKCSSNPMDIPVKRVGVGSPKEDRFLTDRFSYSELWAGPAYSNSPPPSSLPIPKFFSVHRPKRTVSLELPLSPSSEIDFDPISEKAKSAPTSPTGAYHNNSVNDLFDAADTATKTLRRILNLDIADE